MTVVTMWAKIGQRVRWRRALRDLSIVRRRAYLSSVVLLLCLATRFAWPHVAIQTTRAASTKSWWETPRALRALRNANGPRCENRRVRDDGCGPCRYRCDHGRCAEVLMDVTIPMGLLGALERSSSGWFSPFGSQTSSRRTSRPILHKSAMPEDPNATVNKTAHAEAHFVMSSREASNRSCIENRGFTASRRVRAMAVLLK